MDSPARIESPEDTEARLRETAYGLNRGRLFDALGAIIPSIEAGGPPYALVMASLTGLDGINARLGADIGDELITASGLLLRSSLAESDRIYPYGSNTFAILVSDCSEAALEPAAQRMIGLIGGATFPTSAGPMAITLSAGAVALDPKHPSTAADAVTHAQGALDLAKRQAQGSVVLHHPELAAARSAQRRKPTSDLVMTALTEDRLILLLQPIVDVVTAKPALFEGLLRIVQPDGTLVQAADFIEEIEQLGLARLVDKRALELGLALLAEEPRLRLSLNVSSRTAGDAEWMARLRDLTAGTDLTRRLTIEITETAMICDLGRVAAFVDDLRSLGCRTAIDDFGSGYTSFRYLKALNVDMLKIDGAFVSDLPNDNQGRILVKAMIEMATALGLETVAEWVTSEEARDLLRDAGVTYIQGFLYGTPMSVAELKQKGLL